MKAVKRLTLTMTLLLGAAPAALAQSAYTSGTISSRLTAGYPSPYGTESGVYDYAPGYGVRHDGRHRSAAWPTATRGQEDGLSAYGYVPSGPISDDSNSPAATGGGSLGYNQTLLID
jgi:hypothetical protein